jgi:hypothetical protein
MGKSNLIAGGIVISLFLTGLPVAADTAQERSSDGKIQQYTEQQTDLFFEIQKRYITQLQRINSDLLFRHTILAGNYYAARLANAKMKRSMDRGTSIPVYVREVLENLSTQRAKIEAEIKGLEKKKENLKLDVNSFYDGKVPEWLSKEWNEEEREYAESLKEIYETTSELIEKR